MGTDLNWEPILALKTYTGEIFAGFNPDQTLKLGRYTLDPNQVLGCYKALLTGEPDIHIKAAHGTSSRDSLDLKVLMDSSGHVIFFGDIQLPVNEFYRFVAHTFLGDLRQAKTPTGEPLATLSPEEQRDLQAILLIGLYL